MNTHLFLFLVGLCLQTNAQKTFFVRIDGKGDGSSWANATADLNAVLKTASFGDQVWVATGTYTPGHDNDRTASFKIPDGVKVFGGFAGHELSKEARNFHLNPTILSGEIGRDGPDDNCFTVVHTSGVGSATVLDGFVIEAGNSDGVGPVADLERCGGGWYNDGSRNPSNPTIRNCIFRNNRARDGAGMYNNGQFGEASPKIIHCHFLSNIADLDGGAIYNDGRNLGKSNPEIIKTQIIENKANYGAGLFNFGGGGMSSPRLVETQIKRNLAFVRGGGMLNMDVDGISFPVLVDSQIEDNEASVGEGIFQFSSVQGSGIKMLIDPKKMK